MHQPHKSIDEGYIKFNCVWEEKPLAISIPEELKFWRDQMYRWQLIGYNQELNVGYGNISMMIDQQMIVSGTQTGQVYPIEDRHFTLVDDYNIAQNSLHCRGPIKASSESLTHLALYEAHQSIGAIIHIHHKMLWDELLYQLPTTAPNVPYGTSEMALEIQRLFAQSHVLEEKIIVMGGHDEGIITFGKTVKEAGEIISRYCVDRIFR